jgi:hypothetical protein
LSGKAEPIIFQQEGPAHKCRLIDVPWLFNKSIVPPELRDIPFELRLQEFEERFHVEVYYQSEEGAAKPAWSPIRIVDISRDHQVRIGLSWHSRKKGLPNSALASATFSAEQAAWLLQRWQELYEQKCFEATFDAALEEATLDYLSVRRRRQEVLKRQGLDEETIRDKRAEALRKAGLDDRSLETAREVIRQRLRVDPDSIHPPASRPC